MAVAALTPAPAASSCPFAANLTVSRRSSWRSSATLLIGVINGFCVTVIGINALITTLGTLAIFRGLTKVLGDGQTIRIDELRRPRRRRARFLGHPAAGLHLRRPASSSSGSCLRYTVYGRSLYAIGASPTAARLAGIRTKRVMFIAFLLSALCVALAGLIRLSQVGGRLGQRAGSASSCRSSRPSSSAARACRAVAAASAGRSSRC